MTQFKVANEGNLSMCTRKCQNFSKNQFCLGFRPSTGAFTLIELIISMLIFTIFVGVVASTFLLVGRALREANEVRKVYAEARAIMDRLTQDVRLNTLDYSCYAFAAGSSTVALEYGAFNACTFALGQTGATPVLALISADGLHRAVYRFRSGGSGGGGALSVLKLDWQANVVGGGGEWVTAEGFSPGVGFVPFENTSVALEEVGFVVAPLKSPSTLANESQFQPSVHISIRAKSASSRLPEVIPVSLQTTVSSRVYEFIF